MSYLRGLFLILTLGCSSPLAAAEKPNILFILFSGDNAAAFEPKSEVGKLFDKTGAQPFPF